MASLTFTRPPLPTYKRPVQRTTRSPKPARRPRARTPTFPVSQFADSTPARGHHLRPDLDATDAYPAFIPQTIEYAVRQAQTATANALIADHTHLNVQLPMGRSRKHWYRMSPFPASLQESCILAFHFAEMFIGLDITLVIANGNPPASKVDWISHVVRMEHIRSESAFPHRDSSEPRVVIVAAATAKQKRQLQQIVQYANSPKALIFFNCMLDVPIQPLMDGFVHAYICRPLEKCAILLESHDAEWDIFVEIAVFEYEWVGRRARMLDADNEWLPVQSVVEHFVSRRGASRKAANTYYSTPYAGCEAGFWPFMTIACQHVLPLDGAMLDQAARDKTDNKQKKTNTRPFGFF